MDEYVRRGMETSKMIAKFIVSRLFVRLLD